MFGRWLNFCPRARPSGVSRHWLAVAPEAFIRRLPSLGNVLYVSRHPAVPEHETLPRRMLAARAEWLPLLRTRWLASVGVVTTEGPREWIECVDWHGQLQARLHLLPDTDYLAWDDLTAQGDTTATPLPPRQRRSFQPSSAQLLRFRLQSLGGLQVLDADEAVQLSTSGWRLATQVAVAEALPLEMASSH